jgi:hypothetical protein
MLLHFPRRGSVPGQTAAEDLSSVAAACGGAGGGEGQGVHASKVNVHVTLAQRLSLMLCTIQPCFKTSEWNSYKRTLKIDTLMCILRYSKDDAYLFSAKHAQCSKQHSTVLPLLQWRGQKCDSNSCLFCLSVMCWSLEFRIKCSKSASDCTVSRRH